MPFTPAYMVAHHSGLLAQRVAEAVASLADCQLCARRCRVNRLEGETGECRGGRQARVSSAFPHHGEEDIIRGRHGSGTIFLAGCSLHCQFCQNFDISHHDQGTEHDADSLAAAMAGLASGRCHNLNFVTPSHYTAQILEGLSRFAALEGIPRPPIVWNCGGYESPEALALLDGLVDIYMPDFKFLDHEASAAYLSAPDYPAVATAALAEMYRQVGPVQLGEDGAMQRGILVRHLVMPGHLDDTRRILTHLAQDYGTNLAVNVMGQYRPCGDAEKFPELAAPLDYSVWLAARRTGTELGLLPA